MRAMRENKVEKTMAAHWRVDDSDSELDLESGSGIYSVGDCVDDTGVDDATT